MTAITAPRNTLFTVRAKVGQAVAFVYRTAKGELAAVAYVGRSTKSVFHFLFRSLRDVASKVNALFANVAASVARKAADKAAAAAPQTLKVGDVLYRTFGYSMTINAFYRVVALVGKSTVELQKIGSRIVSGDAGYQGSEVADASITIGETFRARVTRNRASLGNGDHASLDDGRAHGFNKMD